MALFAPFAAAPPEWAYWLWALLQLTALAGSLWLLRRWVAEQLGSELYWVFVGSVVVSNAVYFHFYHSQMQFLVLFLLLLAFRFQERDRHTPALLSTLAAGLLKIFPLALLPWSAWKARCRPRAWAACGLAAAAVGILTAGLWPGFVSQGAAVVSENTVN